MAHTLLLADDSITIQRVIELTLADSGIKVIMVSDGEQAVERLRAERPDIVLVAIGLPKRDGYDVASFIQSQPALQGVPVLLLSGAFDNVDDARVRESGVAGVLVKPFEPGLVINRVKELLGMSSKPALPPGSSPVPANDAIPASEVPDERRVARPPMHEPAFAAPRTGGPVAETDRRPARAESWDQLRNGAGVDPESADGEGPATGGADYFDQLDAAFDTLDAQLAGRAGAPGRAPMSRTAPMPRMPAAIDPGRRPSAPASEQYVEPSASPAVRNPVFEVDTEWFGESGPAGAARGEGVESAKRAEAESAAPAAPPETPPQMMAAGVDEPPWYQPQAQPAPVEQPAYQAPVSQAAPYQAPGYDTPAYHQPPQPSQTPPARYVPPPAPAHGSPGAPESAVADAFAALFAEEQGEALPEPPTEPPASFAESDQASFTVSDQASFNLSDEVIERIAARVVDRLTQGLLGQTVSRVVTDVSERLVREEIARIRATASQPRT